MILLRIAVILTVIVHLSACAEPSMTETASTSIAIDLSELTMTASDGNQVRCASAAEIAILRINGRERRRVQIDGDEAYVSFEDVRVVAGTVEFEVEIRSGTDVLLYSGGRIVDVEGNGFEVAIPLERRNGVLVVCPANQVATFRSGGWMTVWNYGERSITFEVVEPPSTCGGPCLFMPRLQDSIGPGGDVPFEFPIASMASGSYTVRVNSSVGPVEVLVQVN